MYVRNKPDAIIDISLPGSVLYRVARVGGIAFHSSLLSTRMWSILMHNACAATRFMRAAVTNARFNGETLIRPIDPLPIPMDDNEIMER